VTCPGCRSARAWSRSQGVGRWRWLRAKCYPCWNRRRWQLHIAGRVGWVLLFVAFMFGPVLLRLWHARQRHMGLIEDAKCEVRR
jgi:hypothetical protein